MKKPGIKSSKIPTNRNPQQSHDQPTRTTRAHGSQRWAVFEKNSNGCPTKALAETKESAMTNSDLKKRHSRNIYSNVEKWLIPPPQQLGDSKESFSIDYEENLYVRLNMYWKMLWDDGLDCVLDYVGLWIGLLAAFAFFSFLFTSFIVFMS